MILELGGGGGGGPCFLLFFCTEGNALKLRTFFIFFPSAEIFFPPLADLLLDVGLGAGCSKRNSVDGWQQQQRSWWHMSTLRFFFRGFTTRS